MAVTVSIFLYSLRKPSLINMSKINCSRMENGYFKIWIAGNEHSDKITLEVLDKYIYFAQIVWNKTPSGTYHFSPGIHYILH